MPRPMGEVWGHFLLISSSDHKKTVSCNYCNVQYKFAQATRLKEHLVKCQKCPAEVKNKIKSEIRPSRVTLPLSSYTAPSSSTTSTAATSALVTSTSAASTSAASTSAASLPNLSVSLDSGVCPLISHDHEESLPQIIDHAELNTVLARAIYVSGVPLSLLESEYWHDVFNILDPTYTVPSRYSLSKPLLEAEYIRIKREINNKLNKAMALALVCDGWTNIVGKGVVNFIVTTPSPIFYNAVNPDIEKETAEYLSGQMIKIIEEIDPAKFTAVVTDNAANMKAAWKIVTSKYPHITGLGCVSHAINLIYKDIFKIPCFKEIIDNVVKVIKYIKITHVVFALFEKLQAEQYGKTSKTLKLYSKTRWSGAFICIESYNQNREALQLIAVSREYSIASQIKEIILNPLLWEKIEEVLIVLQPLAKAILISEKESALLSDVPLLFNNLIENITQKLQTAVYLSQSDGDVIMSSIQNRKDFCVKPIHYAAHQLDPRYCGVCLTDDDISVVSEYLRRISTPLGLDVAKVLKDMAEFRLKENFFDESKSIWIPVNELEPRLWWKTFANNKDISRIAIKILSIPPSSAACERNWSLFSRTHTKTRNRLNNERAIKLMTIRSNVSLIQRGRTNNIPPALDTSEEDIDDPTDPSDNENIERDPLL